MITADKTFTILQNYFWFPRNYFYNSGNGNYDSQGFPPQLFLTANQKA